jgi:hypothetical protein
MALVSRWSSLRGERHSGQQTNLGDHDSRVEAATCFWKRHVLGHNPRAHVRDASSHRASTRRSLSGSLLLDFCAPQSDRDKRMPTSTALALLCFLGMRRKPPGPPRSVVAGISGEGGRAFVKNSIFAPNIRLLHVDGSRGMRSGQASARRWQTILIIQHDFGAVAVEVHDKC